MNIKSKLNVIKCKLNAIKSKLNVIKSKLKDFLLEMLMKAPNLVMDICIIITNLILIALFFIIPIFQDYNSSSFPKYKIISCSYYEVKVGDTLSEIAERYKPKYMKLSNYIVEIQVKNSISKDIKPGDKLLIPMVMEKIK